MVVWCAPLGLTILMSLIVIMLRTNRLICTMAGPSGTTHTTKCSWLVTHRERERGARDRKREWADREQPQMPNGTPGAQHVTRHMKHRDGRARTSIIGRPQKATLIFWSAQHTRKIEMRIYIYIMRLDARYENVKERIFEVCLQATDHQVFANWKKCTGNRQKKREYDGFGFRGVEKKAKHKLLWSRTRTSSAGNTENKLRRKNINQTWHGVMRRSWEMLLLKWFSAFDGIFSFFLISFWIWMEFF